MGTFKNNANRAVAYVRTNQLGHETRPRLARQEALCLEAAAQQGLDVVAVFSDVGSDVASYLPGVRAMLEYLDQSGAPAPAVVVEDITRLGRNVSQVFDVRRRLEKRGSELMFARFETLEDFALAEVLAS